MINVLPQQIALTNSAGPGVFARRDDIEGLRAVAVTAVVLFHYFPAIFAGGFVGVDVFFVISGYVVTLSILRQLAAGRFTLANFYARRIRRLFPALIVVSLACLITSWVFHLQHEFAELGLELLLSSVFVVNVKFAFGPGYFDTSAPASAILHLWSLSVEEQFYLLWPLSVVLICKLPIRLRVGLVAVVLLASFLLHLLLAKYRLHFAFYSFPTRAWEFGAGGAIAMFSLYLPPRPAWAGVISIIGLLLIVSSLFLLGSNVVFPACQALWPVLGAGLMIAAAASPVNSEFLAATAITWIGKRSYPIYLWHWPPIVFYKYVFESDPSLPVVVAMLLAVVAISHLTYIFVEKPFRAAPASDDRPWMSRRAVPFLVTSSLLIAVFASLAWRSYLSERSWPARQILAARDDWMFTDQHIILRGALTDTLVLFGDSYVQQYIPRFKKLSEDNVPNLMQIEAFTHGGCAPVPLVNRRTIRECLPFVERGFDLSMQPRVRRVLLGASWRGFLDRGDYFDPATDTAIDPSSEAGSFAWEGFQQRIAALVGAGKKVYLMLNPPWGKIADPASLARNYGGKKSISISQHNERQGPVNARLTKIAWRTGAIALDPVSWLCNGDTCPVTTDSGEPIFKDAFHLRASYVRDLPVLDRYALP